MSEPKETDEQHPAEQEVTPPPAPGGDSTAGTGTGIALGCIAITVILTLLGILFILALRWLG